MVPNTIKRLISNKFITKGGNISSEKAKEDQKGRREFAGLKTVQWRMNLN